MPNLNDNLRDRLAPSARSKISRKSGKAISIPVWFVLEGKKLYAG
jgi:hypothetical protein